MKIIWQVAAIAAPAVLTAACSDTMITSYSVQDMRGVNTANLQQGHYYCLPMRLFTVKVKQQIDSPTPPPADTKQTAKKKVRAPQTVASVAYLIDLMPTTVADPNQRYVADFDLSILSEDTISLETSNKPGSDGKADETACTILMVDAKAEDKSAAIFETIAKTAGTAVANSAPTRDVAVYENIDITSAEDRELINGKLAQLGVDLRIDCSNCGQTNVNSISKSDGVVYRPSRSIVLDIRNAAGRLLERKYASTFNTSPLLTMPVDRYHFATSTAKIDFANGVPYKSADTKTSEALSIVTTLGNIPARFLEGSKEVFTNQKGVATARKELANERLEQVKAEQALAEKLIELEKERQKTQAGSPQPAANSAGGQGSNPSASRPTAEDGAKAGRH